MTAVIKFLNMFRAMGAISGAWYYGDLVRGTHIYHNGRETTIIPETVGFCTNCQDKNGTYIFSGDILEYINEDGDITRYVVSWEDYYFGIIPHVKLAAGTVDSFDKWYAANMTVVGNIHEKER